MRKTFYFNDIRVIEKLKHVCNQSRYVSDLILDDLDGKKVTKKEVLEMIGVYCGKGNMYNVEDTKDLENSILSAMDI